MTTQATGGSPERLLQDQSRELSRWLAERLGARQCVRDACVAILARQQPANHFPDAGKMVAKAAA